MGWKCCVPNCRSGYDGTKEKVSFFKVPNSDDMLEKWRKAIPRKDRHITIKDRVCEKHFQKEEIVKSWEFHGVKEDYKIPRLHSKAVPTVFPNCPSYLSKSISKKRRIITKHVSAKKQKTEDITTRMESIPSTSQCMPTENFVQCAGNADIFNSIWNGDLLLEFSDKSWAYHNVHKSFNEKVILISHVKYHNGALLFEKQIELTQDNQIHLYIKTKSITNDNVLLLLKTTSVTNEDDINSTVNKFHGVHICHGGPNLLKYKSMNSKIAQVDNEYNNWRHRKCNLITFANNNICEHCKKLEKYFDILNKRRSQYNKKPKKRSLNLCVGDNLRIFKKTAYNSNCKVQKKIRQLQNSLEVSRKEYNALLEESLEDQLAKLNLAPTLKSIILECFKLGKCKNKKGRRYSGDWILTCLLLHIRSKSTYKFLQTNEILPLPAISTVKRYLYFVKIKCGIDDSFFKALGERMKSKTQMQKHGILIFDEMSVRTSLDVNVHTMKYDGVVDFGGDVIDPNISKNKMELVDHALVFMFSSVGDHFNQPIVVYGAKGPTKGSVLAKLCLKIIIELEKVGCFVDGVVCDGATTNKKMWAEFGISGKLKNFQNKMAHPCNMQDDNSRNLYFFSDAPHLIKCIRNRLQNNKVLKPPEGEVFWQHYETLFKEDTKLAGHLRACPKITHSHIYPSSMMKMRVSLATQIFSNAVSDGLQFYKNESSNPNLQNADSTIKFTKRINDMFGALNRKKIYQALRPGCPDFKILQDSLEWLNLWEKQCARIKSAFLTNLTAEGLRVTLKSTEEFSIYLLEQCNFEYVLSGKINQDPLEHFFGIIRQAAGQNDHPTFISFMHLYRMLSTYSIIKPPKYGNCSVKQTNPIYKPSFSLEEFKNIFGQEAVQSGKQMHIENLQNKLDGIIENCDLHHTYITFPDEINCPTNIHYSSIVDGVVYYVIGFVCKSILKSVKCSVCISSLTSKKPEIPESEFTILKTRGALVHPNINMYNILRMLEKYLVKNISSEDAYENTLTKFLLNEEVRLFFPCSIHKNQIISTIVHCYILLRMRQYCKQEDRIIKKESREIKKKSRLALT